MRRLFTAEEAMRRGMTRAALRWGAHAGRWRSVCRGVYIIGADDPTPLERALAVVVACDGTASGTLAGVLLELDSVTLRGPGTTIPSTKSGRRQGARRVDLQPERITTVQGVRCTDGLQTLLDLAALLDDLTWEQAFSKR